MAVGSSRLCLRCGRQNVPRARYCAQCGLDLLAGGDGSMRSLHQRRRRSGVGVVLALLLLGLFLAAMGSLFRAHPRTLRPAVPPRPVPFQDSRSGWIELESTHEYEHSHSDRDDDDH